MPRPTPTVAVVHSPTPSTVRMAASGKGEQKKALAAWERWCSLNRIREGGSPSRFWRRCRIHILSPSQGIIASWNRRRERGNVCMHVSRRRSNLRNGFSKNTT